jgi:hypothetical protein
MGAETPKSLRVEPWYRATVCRAPGLNTPNHRRDGYTNLFVKTIFPTYEVMVMHNRSKARLGSLPGFNAD